jgi:hypothetical protein
MRAFDYRSHRVANLGIVLAPKVMRRRLAAALAGGLENGRRRLDSLRVFELAQVIPGREKNNLFGIDNNDAVDIAIVGQEDGAFFFSG